LEIMKDSRIGTFGAIALFSILSLKYLFLYEIDTAILPVVLIAGHSISRFISITFLITHSYARQNDSTSKSGIISQHMSLSEIIIAGIFGILPMFLLDFKYFLVLIPLLIIRQFTGHYLTERINGFTGDTLGAAQQLSEICFYVTVFLLAKWTFI
ncbi:MAG: adenosylcobinamide-GDP ribazoletransferase, partial [Candidatus Aenigmarchaeota archaeon]|nr:adenosylcobinamide-GDP ribazoletransferase [Candidatus Aenigmarchaeota archaeon]